MISSRLALALVIASSVTLASEAAAQLPVASVTVSPNPVQLDGTITVTLTAATDGMQVRTAATIGDCVGTTITAGSPTGPMVFCSFAFPLCGNPRVLFRCETTSSQHTICSTQFNPGLHYIKVTYLDPAGNFINDFAPFEVAGAGTAVLAATNSPQVGGSTTMNLSSSPGAAGQVYLVLGSFSTNSGFSYRGSFMSVDPDGLLFATLALPNTFPANSLGVLDSQGNSPPMLLSLPPIPELACLPLTFQALVGLGQPSPNASTVLDFTIQP